MLTTFKEDIPPNLIELKILAGKHDDWKSRLRAIEELGEWKCNESISILWDHMLNDKVYKIQEAAFKKLQRFDEKVKLPRKSKGNLIKGIDKPLKIIKDSLTDDHNFQDFKEKLKIDQPEIFDTYEGDKGNQFEKWLINKWSSLPKK